MDQTNQTNQQTRDDADRIFKERLDIAAKVIYGFRTKDKVALSNPAITDYIEKNFGKSARRCYETIKDNYVQQGDHHE